MAQSSNREICATNTSLLPYLNPIFLQILYATRSTEQNYTSSRPTLSSNESPNTNKWQISFSPFAREKDKSLPDAPPNAYQSSSLVQSSAGL